MVFSDIYNAVADQFGDTSAAMITRIKRYINWTQQDVASRENWEFLFDTDTFNCVAATATYSLDSTAEKVISMINATSKNKLSHISSTDIDLIDPAGQSSGSPYMWSEYGRDATGYLKIKLFPIPASTDTINYSFRKRLTDLSGDSDISAIPVKYHRVLYLGALTQCMDYDQDPQSSSYRAEYENMIEDMRKDLVSGSEDTYNVMGRVGSYSKTSELKLPPEHFSN